MTQNEPETTWTDRARELHELGGVPKQRAKVVALSEAGLSHGEIADELGLSSRGSIQNHIERYREEVKEDTWHAHNHANV